MSDQGNNLDDPDAEVSIETVDNASLGRYFNNTTHTIFDELVSSEKPDAFATVKNPVFEIPTTSPSGFFDNETESLNEPSLANDLQRDVWIASESTTKILRTIATSTNGTNSINRELLTMPGLAMQDDMIDPTKGAVLHILGEDEFSSRNVLTASDVTQDERGLRNLIQAGCYRAAINLTGRLLAVYGQGFGKINLPSKHTPHSLQLWFTRLSLLTKLRQIEILETESRPFGNLDKPDMYFIYYPELYGTRPGSMASFSFRLLLAEIPTYLGKSKQAIDNLYQILAIIKKIVKNLAAGLSGDGSQIKNETNKQEDVLRLWNGRKCRTLISIINCAMGMKNYILASEILENLYSSMEWKKAEGETLTSAIGRVHLILGDVSAAEKQFLITRDTPPSSKNIRELVDRGLMAVAQNAFQEALNCFQSASALDPSNVMLRNNIAVCLLYTGKLEAAVLLMENAMTRNPIKCLQESIILNLCTLYELHTTHSKQSKLHLLRQINKFKGDSFDIGCLQLGT
ncbi:trafficking protein particle complex subunit 12 [Leptopilina heterotoma]|uniref:trafficking protein particle complex subunit 12 n=1 Tax=Leptopilina heterotoma TaxID=63436 RepID=UPI001CA9E3FA|nr:trafficking protein particle complex subunit 12 [Leptopilina heterotoma]